MVYHIERLFCASLLQSKQPLHIDHVPTKCIRICNQTAYLYPLPACLPFLALQTAYNISHLSVSFDDVRFAMVDTLFSLAEAYLFMQVVELKVGAGVFIHTRTWT